MYQKLIKNDILHKNNSTANKPLGDVNYVIVNDLGAKSYLKS